MDCIALTHTDTQTTSRTVSHRRTRKCQPSRPRLDAEPAYGDLDDFRITIVRRADGWHIDYELLDATREGGGPHYVIDAPTGQILAKRYEQ